jgi:Kef-type K+ transport system membrane component KefB
VLQAGLLLAETEFAIQVESDIAPYKGLLMGLFFMTVGMEISCGLFLAKLRLILGGILLLLVGKVRSPCRTALVSQRKAKDVRQEGSV